MPFLAPDDELDAIDEEHIRQVMASRGFQLIAERVERIRTGYIQRLLTADLAEVPGLQHSIRTLQLVLGTPKQIIGEIKASESSKQT